LIIALVAGEPSGDALGADLIADLSKIYPGASFIGIAGPRMQAAGCQSLFPMETLSVMGIAEVLPKLPAILSVRKKLLDTLIPNPPDVFIGIDAPDFNLPVERALKKRGIKTVHYVSPTVWAWREKRVLSIKKSTDLMLCLFPFEPAVYEKYGMKAAFIGHPAAERLRLSTADHAMRAQLGYGPDDLVLAILPGSRSMEIKHLAPLFIAVADWLHQKYPTIKFVIPAVNERIKDEIVAIFRQLPFTFNADLLVGSSDRVMDAADIVLCTSGTTTLEAMILNKPMVVAYKMSRFNWWLAQRLVKVKYVALPNLLADKPMVPEYVQNDANIYNVTQAVEQWIAMPDRAEHCKALYEPYNRQLSQHASQQAAKAIAQLLSD
jgi:lipid-A-disaccharide synthase